MELRWFNGKLQKNLADLSSAYDPDNWVDVPTVKDEQKREEVKECEHDFDYGPHIASNQCRKCKEWVNLKPKETQEWCEHMESTHAKAIYYPGMTEPVNFCPICGTPRPKAKSLEEKLKEGCVWTFTPGIVSSHPDWKTLAQIAEQHFKEQAHFESGESK